MTKSLYAAFGERVVATDPDPGTLYTASVETIDNDVLMQELALVTGDNPSPVARIPRIVEDDAHHATEPLALGPKPRPAPRPQPHPGTRLTATVETTDEGGSTYLDHLR